MDNLRLAHKNARKKKTHYKEVKEVDKDVDKYCKMIQDMLVNKTFTTSEYKVKMKNDRGKIREIFVLPYFPDRIIHHAIMQVLEPIWKKTFITHTYQSIKDRGIHKCKRDVEKITKSDVDFLYCYKIDICKFYPSINNGIMKSVVRRKIKCKDTLWLLGDIIDSTEGVPIGNYLSQFLGNLYLTYFDHYVKEVLRCRYYFRYCDDIVLISESKGELVSYIEPIKRELSKLRLEVKSNEQLFEVGNRGVDFVGYVFYIKYTLLRESIKRRMLTAPTTKSYPSYYGWLIHCNGYNLLKKYKEKINESTK